MEKIGIGLYGTNGHQIQNHLVNHAGAELVGVAAMDAAALPESLRGVPAYASLEELLSDDRIQLVSLCSPTRREQAAQAVACLRAGRHVYAEKPCAMTEDDLDAIIATSRRTGKRFHEMAGTVVDRPYGAMRQAVLGGDIGEVVQVFAQKSYPWMERRPANEDIDGGLARQVGIYVARFVEHIACRRIASIRLVETRHGNADPIGGSRMAVGLQMTLAGGGIASGICNYLNPMGKRIWGYEILRIFGTRGVVESDADTGVASVIPLDGVPRALDLAGLPRDYFDLFIDSLRDGASMPLSLEDELSPTRWVIRAKA